MELRRGVIPYVNGWLNSWWGEEGVEIPTSFGGDDNDATLIYGADDRAKWLMTNDEVLKKEITQLFGAKAYTKAGSLDRKHIADLRAAIERVDDLSTKIIFLNSAQAAILDQAVEVPFEKEIVIQWPHIFEVHLGQIEPVENLWDDECKGSLKKHDAGGAQSFITVMAVFPKEFDTKSTYGQGVEGAVYEPLAGRIAA